MPPGRRGLAALLVLCAVTGAHVGEGLARGSPSGSTPGLARGLAPSEEDFAFEPDPPGPAPLGSAPLRPLPPQGSAPHGSAARALHPPRPATPAPIQRQWGVQDTSATVGKLFRFSIPVDAFAGDVDHYEAQGPNGGALPSWLLFDQTSGLFEGVPSFHDVGEVYVTVRAISSYTSAKDKFSIDVIPPKVDTALSAGVVPLGLTTHHHPKVKCGPGEDTTTLSIVMDVKYDHMKPHQRVSTIDNISGFLSLSHDLFQLLPQIAREDILGEDSVVMAGEGNVKKRKWKQSSVIQWQVGCDGKVWPQQLNVVEDLKQQARDGTLAEVLRWPVIGWHVKTVTNSNAMRGRRDAVGQHEAGSGNYAEDGSPDDSEGGEGGVPETRIVPTMASPVPPAATATPIHTHPHSHNTHIEQPQHHHRHRHGDLELGVGSQEVENTVEEFGGSRQDSGQLAPYLSSSFGVGYNIPSSSVLYANIIPTPTLNPEKPTLLHPGAGAAPEISRSFDGVEVTPSPVLPTDLEPTMYPNPGSSGSSSYGSTSGSSTTEHYIHVTDPMTDGSPSSSSSSTSSSSSGSSTTTASSDHTSESIDVKVSTERPVTIIDLTSEQDYDSLNSTSMGRSSTAPPSTTGAPTPPPTTSTTSEYVEIDQKNFPPKVQTRLRKLQVTAGKILRYVVPDDTFTDLEDGNTRNLKLVLKTEDGQELDQTSWIFFNSARREVVMLPLEENVSKWSFLLEATDKEGATVSDTLDITVQHHKNRHSCNHEITLVMEPTSLLRQQRVLLWEVVLVETLAQFFGDADQTHITVRRLDLAYLNSNGSVSFTYTNDSLPRTHCPEEDIQKMLKVLRRNEAGEPSNELLQALNIHAAQLNIRKVLYKGRANCEQQPPTHTDVHGKNFPPVPRNQVDHINATVGQLLIYKVPEDSFYDPEEGPARNMKLSLLTIDHSPIPSENWLQFDVKNQEFYGIPMSDDEGSKEYQLVCEDRDGLSAHDGLVVVVHPIDPPIPYSVEFSITIHPPYDSFIHNAGMKRKFVEKLRTLFRDPDTSSIVLGKISKFALRDPPIGEVSERAKRENRPIRSLQGSTVVNWYNRSLPTSFCPNNEIHRLRRVLVNEDNQISQGLSAALLPEFNVHSVGLYPTAVCQGELTPLHPTEPPPPPVDEFARIGSSEEYLVTFVVPAVIICTMLLLAGVVACVLYRRRRTGKMSVGDEDERQSFRNKGIPVIFQDELEERPDPANKSPVIMKEEKPPLPPPEYQRHNPSPPPTQALLSDAEDAEPYHPPPPFTTSRDTARHTRHKSTPTYRKPPPYVPP